MVSESSKAVGWANHLYLKPEIATEAGGGQGNYLGIPNLSHIPPVVNESMVLHALGGPILAGYNTLYLTCKNLAPSEQEKNIFGLKCRVKAGGYPMLARFPMKVGLNFMNFFTNDFGFQSYRFTYHDITNIDQFTFKFVDEDGKEVDFKGYDHSFTLRITHSG